MPGVDNLTGRRLYLRPTRTTRGESRSATRKEAAWNMKVGSLFAGIGGFDLAAERVGMKVAWQSELDPHASRVLAHHWPDVPNLGDIHEIGCSCHLPAAVRWDSRNPDSPDIDNRRIIGQKQSDTDLVLDRGDRCERCGRYEPPAVDVLTGGFPCQDYSVAGSRAGLAGDRGALWWQMHRIIAQLRPTWVVGENVPGLLSSRGGADFETIIRSLTELGYGVAWAVLDAQYFGVAQRRRRVFIVGHSGGVPRPEILALSEGLYGHPAPSREAGKRTAPALAARTRGGGELETHTELDGGLIAFNWQTGSHGMLSPRSTHTDALHAGQTPAIAIQGTTVGRSDDAGPRGSGYLDDGSMFTPETVSPHAVATSAVAVQESQAGVREYDTAGTIRSEAPGSQQGGSLLRHGFRVRRLTPLECERLQGFPDYWTAVPGNSDTQRYRQLGNAVAVPVVEWILGNIVKAVLGPPEKPQPKEKGKAQQ